MRIFSIVLAIGVSISLYFLVVDRKSLVSFLNKWGNLEQVKNEDNPLENKPLIPEIEEIFPHVIVKRSESIKTNNILLLRGQTEAARKVEVRSEISGAVISAPRSKGTKIETGETLCEIAAGIRFVTLSEAKVRLLEAEKKAKVVESLGQKGYSTETNNLTQKTFLEAAKASLAKAEYDISKLLISAPFAGILENNTAELGSYLNKGSLCGTIIDLSHVKLIGYVPELKIRAISVGANASAKTVSGIKTNGSVTFISKQADPITKTFKVEITAENSELKIRDGETVEISVELASDTAHLLPQSVLTLNDDGTLGVRAVVDGTVKFFEVKILRDQVDGLLLTGLPKSINVITVGQEFVLDGQKVDVSYEKSK